MDDVIEKVVLSLPEDNIYLPTLSFVTVIEICDVLSPSPSFLLFYSKRFYGLEGAKVSKSL